MTPTSIVPSHAVDLDGVDRVVIVAPHPDDEALACGILIATAAAAGLEVRVLAVTDGEAAYADVDPDVLASTRRREQGDALAELGILPDALHRLSLPDGHVARHRHTVADAARRHLGRRTLLVAPSIHDWHPDHVACGVAAGLAAARACGRLGARWSSLFWAHQHPDPLLASRPILVQFAGTPRTAAARRAAIGRHRSQFHHGTGPAILTESHLAHLDDTAEVYVQEHP